MILSSLTFIPLTLMLCAAAENGERSARALLDFARCNADSFVNVVPVVSDIVNVE